MKTSTIALPLSILAVCICSLSSAQFIELATGTNTTLHAYSHQSSIIVTGRDNYFATVDPQGNKVTPLRAPSDPAFQTVSLSTTPSVSSLYTMSADLDQAHYRIRRSDDGGASWSTIFDTTGIYLLSFKMINPSFGIAGGLFGTVLTTIDAGQTWSSKRPFDNVDQYSAIDAFNENLVIMGGTEASKGYFYRTTDKGNTWTKIGVESQPDFIPTSIKFLNATTVVAVGINRNPYEAFFYRSFDGGLSWTSSPLGTGKAFNDVQFINEREGYVVGATHGEQVTGLIMKTVDGGETWSEIPTTFLTELNNIVIVDASLAMLAGSNGTLLRWNRSEIATGLDAAPNTAFAFYPNPASSQLFCSVKNIAPNTTAQIVAMDGKTVIRETDVVTDRFDLNVSSLTSGTYFVVVQNVRERTVRQFVKQ